MEITGKIITVFPEQKGTSAKGEWKKQEFLFETQAQYPKKIIMANWNDKLDLNFDYSKTVKINFDLESREYNGRWFTDVKPWKIEVAGQAPMSNPEEPHGSENSDLPWDNDPVNDLPF